MDPDVRGSLGQALAGRRSRCPFGVESRNGW